MTNKNKVERLADFPDEGYIAQFFGATFEDAVSAANKSGLNCNTYYCQIHKGKQVSILVNYTR